MAELSWPYTLYHVLLLLNLVGCCLAQLAFDEDFFAKVAVGIFICFVIGFIFSVVMGFLLQFSRLIASKQPTNPSGVKAEATPSTSRVMHTDGRTVNVVSLSELEASYVSHASLNNRSDQQPAHGNDIRESLYAEIDLKKKKSQHDSFFSDRYPAVDYK